MINLTNEEIKYIYSLLIENTKNIQYKNIDEFKLFISCLTKFRNKSASIKNFEKTMKNILHNINLLIKSNKCIKEN